MFVERAPYAGWGDLLTADNIHDVDQACGPLVYIYSHTTGMYEYERLRPYGFSLIQGEVMVETIDNDDNQRLIKANQLPGLGLLPSKYIVNNTATTVISLHHRQGRTSAYQPFPEREDYLRLLAANPVPLDDMAAAHFVFGEHPKYPGEKGIYIGAVQLGRISLHQPEPYFYPPSQHVMRYFPLPLEQPEIAVDPSSDEPPF